MNVSNLTIESMMFVLLENQIVLVKLDCLRQDDQVF